MELQKLQEFKKKHGKNFLHDSVSLKKKFQKIVWDFYHTHGRFFPWRKTHDPYRIVVSEIMLQQTQTNRVVPKYHMFLKIFPDIKTLAKSPFLDVLHVWSGLGYNRRARYVHMFAKRVVEQHGGIIPQDENILETFDGIGWATARSIVAFAFNFPSLFVETNIRALFIYLLCDDEQIVHDHTLLPFVDVTLDRTRSCVWYYALTDLGVAVKRQYKNPAQKSIHYVKQAHFKGSNRQIRGKILKLLLQKQKTKKELLSDLGMMHESYLCNILNDLVKEKLICFKGNYCVIA